MKCLLLIVLALSGCATIDSTGGCPGDRIGQWTCSADGCRPSYEGEVFHRLGKAPPNAAELLQQVEIPAFSRKLWYASNTGKFKVFVGGPNNGYAYEFSKNAAGWTATFEKDAYACTS